MIATSKLKVVNLIILIVVIVALLKFPVHTGEVFANVLTSVFKFFLKIVTYVFETSGVIGG